MAEFSEATFDLSGGALCLDFANTREDRDRAETERLGSYRDLLAFARQTRILHGGQTGRLQARAGERPAEAERAHAAAKRLRDLLYRVFSARAAGRHPEAADLERLSATCAAVALRLRLRREGRGYAWAWEGLDESLDALLGPIARSAAELLTSDELERLRECRGGGCTWLFLDASRNRSRRWCSMETCGNRAKARRHYRRRRAADR